MIKVVLSCLAFILSSTLVYLSKGNTHDGKCAMEVTGVVSTMGDPTSGQLVITSNDKKRYIPRISDENAVLVLGQKVKACGNPAGVSADGLQVIAVDQIAVLP